MSSVTATPTADLLAHARQRGVPLSRQGAQQMLRRRGADGARERIDAIAALMDLASALGRELSPLAAARRLDAAGGYDGARKRLVLEDRIRRGRIFDREWARAEAEWWARDAARRHAAHLVARDHGSLGHRASLTLLAARHAGLTRPSADVLRARLTRAVNAEISRRHPARPDDVDVIPDDPIEREQWERERERYLAHVERVLAAERAARELFEARLRDDDGLIVLAHAIDRLADHPAFRRDIERALGPALARLRESAGAGSWRPDPDGYRDFVINAAARAAQAA